MVFCILACPQTVRWPVAGRVDVMSRRQSTASLATQFKDDPPVGLFAHGLPCDRKRWERLHVLRTKKPARLGEAIQCNCQRIGQI